jgi:hypothetical protein
MTLEQGFFFSSYSSGNILYNPDPLLLFVLWLFLQVGDIVDYVDKKHLAPLLEALIKTSKASGFPLGIHLHKRALDEEETDLILDYIKRCPVLGHVKLENVAAFSKPKDAMRLLKEISKNESTEGISFRSMWTTEKRYRKVWKKVADIIKTHTTLKHISLSTCSSTALEKVHSRAANRNKEHDVNTIVLAALAERPHMEALHLRNFGLQEANGRADALASPQAVLPPHLTVD